MHREVLRRHRVHWGQWQFALSSMLAMVFFSLASFVVFPFSTTFANSHAGAGVPDLILSNIPTFDVDGYFVYGAFLLIALIAALCIVEPRRIPFTLNSLSLLIVIRSIFVMLTHMGPPAAQVANDFGPTISKAFFGDDFFFSGHTAIPFLMALVFWNHRPLRYIFLAWSVFFATVALLGHLHYSIDVFSAYFITYAVYALALWLFPKDYDYLRAAR